MGMHRSRGSILCTGLMSIAGFAIASSAMAVDLQGNASAKAGVDLGNSQEYVRGEHTIWVEVTNVAGEQIADAGVSLVDQAGQRFRGHVLSSGTHYVSGIQNKVTIEITCPGLGDVQTDLRLPNIVKNANVEIVIDENGLVSMIARPVGPNLAEFDMNAQSNVQYAPGTTEGFVCDGSETPEGEPVCMDEYIDGFNGGLNSSPAVYSPIACGETVCGESGNFLAGGLGNRDTDWYLVSLAAQTEVTWTVTAAGWGHAITTVDISVPGGAVVGEFLVSVAGETLSVSNCLPPGDWALFASTSGFAGVACGSQYQGSVTCTPCAAPETGACCNSDGSCTDDVLEADCFGAGGLAWFASDFCFFVQCPDPPEICGPGAGDCFSANGTPGCEDIPCCEAVCAADPFCCDTEWDQICANAALIEPACGAPTAQACCFSDGSCADNEPADCTAAGGTPQGAGTSCAGIICPPPAGPNDECEGALDIGPLPATVVGTTSGQGNDVAPFCGTTDGTGGGVWYTLLGTGNTITLTTCTEFGGNSDYDTKIRVYCSCDGLECVAGNDDGIGCSAFRSLVSFCSQPGAEYKVLVHGFGAAEGSFSLLATDDGTECSGAVVCVEAPPAGACCFTVGPCGEGECVDGLEQADCEGQGGIYQGDDTMCVGGFVGYEVQACGNAFASISATGTLAPTASSSDDGGDFVPLGFTFPYFISGTTHTEVGIASNGYLTFGTDVSDFTNDPIPSTTDPNDLIAPYWEDWSPNVAGDVYYESDGSTFTASWEGVSPFGGGTPSDFQVSLSSDGSIEFRVGTTDGGVTPVQGIENSDGTVGIDTGPPAQNSCAAIAAITGDPINCDTPDTTPPMVECSVMETCEEAGDSSGSSGSHSHSSASSCSSSELQHVVSYTASDDCGEVTVEAIVLSVCESEGFIITKSVQVSNGDALDIRCNGNSMNDSSSEEIVCSSSIKNGVLTIRADSASLIVTATDEAGNTSTCEVDLCGPAPAANPSGIALPMGKTRAPITNQGRYQLGR